MESGYSVEVIQDTKRQRPIFIEMWYPVEDQESKPYDYGLGSGRIVESGRIKDGKYPLVTLSHGAMGAARNYSWLTESLARDGHIVVGVSHYGESYMHGLETIDPAAVVRSWERPLDISYAISHALENSWISSSIAVEQIGFIGHSSGGATGLQLAGVLFDREKMTDYCSSPSAANDKGCEYAANVSLEDDASIEGLSYRDERVQAFVILDPALGPGFHDFSGVPASSKILIIGSVENDFLPFKHHAERISIMYPNAKTHWLRNGEGHFVYLNSCESDIEANGVPLCVDREGVSREAVHRNLIDVIGEHFRNLL